MEAFYRVGWGSNQPPNQRERLHVITNAAVGRTHYYLHQDCIFIGVSLLVSKQYYTKTSKPIFTNFGGKVAHGSRKKRLGSSHTHDTSIAQCDSGPLSALVLSPGEKVHVTCLQYGPCLHCSAVFVI